ncbi:M48 family metalloprotease [Actinoalloteichus hymeniacidonis]|uniref:Zn-dependent protease with chaperone function n=1 Tax=Actinoalloteichus hymeniacidonis TaxID=340345 RepID=A0AAC9MZ94_9PSEU|nr:M48 family metalloprotease [Actinoalloteichus hymeniacidonis]AOS65188.1 Zn-dependent protease with chaperone function [Actinoalloteichus hymeniacidonis]MBB5906732.1 STE24 endopeptidase [Actinoalloteichus hymeniacidonis]
MNTPIGRSPDDDVRADENPADTIPAPTAPDRTGSTTAALETPPFRVRPRFPSAAEETPLPPAPRPIPRTESTRTASTPRPTLPEFPTPQGSAGLPTRPEPPPRPGRAAPRRASGPPTPPPLPTGAAPIAKHRIDMTAWLGLLLSLPWTLSSLGLVVMVSTMLGDRLWAPLLWLIPLGWLASGAVIFLAGCERLLARVSLNSRPPSEGERRIVEPVWETVLDDVVVDPRRFQLWVQDTQELNAGAAGGRIVIVTKGALRLPPRALAAVLAHELGHHLGGHSVVLRLHGWYSIPTRIFLALVIAAIGVIGSIGRAIARTGNVFGIVLSLAALVGGIVLVVYLSPLLLLVPVASVFLAATSRMGEIRADRMAAQLGYGPALIEVLGQWMRDSQAAHRPPPSLRTRLFASHPSHAVRIRKVEEYLAGSGMSRGSR